MNFFDKLGELLESINSYEIDSMTEEQKELFEYIHNHIDAVITHQYYGYNMLAQKQYDLLKNTLANTKTYENEIKFINENLKSLSKKEIDNLIEYEGIMGFSLTKYAKENHLVHVYNKLTELGF